MHKLNPDNPIVVVEDSQEDFTALIRAFKHLKITNPVIHCETAEEVVSLLGLGSVKKAPGVIQSPALIILDLNLPGSSGRYALEEIKKDPLARAIPVVILTTSSDAREVKDCYLHGANSYMHKPVSPDAFFRAIETLQQYWFNYSLLPEVPVKLMPKY